MKLFDFLKRKTKEKSGLEEAFDLGLISKQELLEIKILRKEAELKREEAVLENFLESKKRKVKK